MDITREKKQQKPFNQTLWLLKTEASFIIVGLFIYCDFLYP